MKPLYLNLFRLYFDMILSGEKKTEYRKLTYYWANRFFDIPKEEKLNIKGRFERYGSLAAFYCKANFKLKDFKSVVFANGMKNPEKLPIFEIEFKGICIDGGKEEWGAKKDAAYFCIELGNVIKKSNC